MGLLYQSLKENVLGEFVMGFFSIVYENITFPSDLLLMMVLKIQRL